MYECACTDRRHKNKEIYPTHTEREREAKNEYVMHLCRRNCENPNGSMIYVYDIRFGFDFDVCTFAFCLLHSMLQYRFQFYSMFTLHMRIRLCVHMLLLCW